MAARNQPHYALSLPLLFMALSTTLSFIITSSNAAECTGSIAVYWGQRSDGEGSLEEACDSGNYNIVILQSLIVYNDGRTPDLNLVNHCGTPENPCSNLEPVIKHCQDIGIKVFLSIGFVVGSVSPPEGKNVTSDLADYLVETFLSGKAGGPLGAVSLDGIDIAAVPGSQDVHWDQLVTLLNAASTTDRRIYISASPQCVYPDAFLGAAIRTGHVDYVWVGFYYNNPSCIYSGGNSENLLNAWGTWTSNVPNSLIFLGLTANKDLAGYIEPEVVNSQILPAVKTASNYGGVMIWDRYYDITNDDYSGKIKDSVPKCACDKPAYTRFNDRLKLARSFI